MKLKKLLTLSQFVTFVNSLNLTAREKLILIVKYNDFLKQKPEKGMFVNPYEKPKVGETNNCDFYAENIRVHNEHCSCELGECKKLEQYIEAEKKVIFKGWEATDEFYLTYKNQTSIDIDDVEFWLESMDFGEYINQEINTLHDLAEATGGELEIDVEI